TDFKNSTGPELQKTRQMESDQFKASLITQTAIDKMWESFEDGIIFAAKRNILFKIIKGFQPEYKSKHKRKEDLYYIQLDDLKGWWHVLFRCWGLEKEKKKFKDIKIYTDLRCKITLPYSSALYNAFQEQDGNSDNHRKLHNRLNSNSPDSDFALLRLKQEIILANIDTKRLGLTFQSLQEPWTLHGVEEIFRSMLGVKNSQKSARH
ncbi:21737_t:CDS:2, partial [Gigaspora margarita]